MLRWLVRLLVLALIAIAGAILVSRLTNREEDFDDYDDLEAGFDFQETPVEIEVPAEASVAQSNAGSSGSSSDTGGASMSASSGTRMQTGILDSEMAGVGKSDVPLTDIVGIGPSYDARLKALGIATMSDLAQADANTLSEQLDVIGGLATIEDWISQAKSMSSSSSSNGHA